MSEAREAGFKPRSASLKPRHTISCAHMEHSLRVGKAKKYRGRDGHARLSQGTEQLKEQEHLTGVRKHGAGVGGANYSLPAIQGSCAVCLALS